jgi:hypothetical protein
MNTDRFRQLPLGETCGMRAARNLPPGDDVRHGSASVHLPLEGKLVFAMRDFLVASDGGSELLLPLHRATDWRTDSHYRQR